MTRLILRGLGGFTGPAGAQTRSIDLARLAPAQAHRLAQLLDACQFFNLPEQLRKIAPQSGDFLYELQVDKDGWQHAVHYHLDAAPLALRQLTDQLNHFPPD
ncbi:protealysin inhibitor emfourin [Duganella fentianensis]|uniref:protealysin inhibitor emfourin n=1 Tax=Duganella fentianensis TaxID=2692177 RepID=UPI0032B2A8B6